ncbi:MAG: hypothetical protein WC145_12080 [Aliarcobacter sp.]
MTESEGVYGAEAMECLAKLECGISDTPFEYIGLSTDGSEPTDGQTFMSGEVVRLKATASYEAPGTAVWTRTFEFEEDLSIKKVGVFDAPEGGHMLLQGLLSVEKNVGDGDELTIMVKDANSPLIEVSGDGE